jgi:hypothetical protein
MPVDDAVALVGVVSLLSGVYLLAGLPVALILFGIIAIFVGWRMPGAEDEHGTDKEDTTVR